MVKYREVQEYCWCIGMRGELILRSECFWTHAMTDWFSILQPPRVQIFKLLRMTKHVQRCILFEDKPIYTVFDHSSCEAERTSLEITLYKVTQNTTIHRRPTLPGSQAIWIIVTRLVGQTTCPSFHQSFHFTR